MANFDGIDHRINSAYAALDLFNMWRTVYQQSAELRRRLDLYLGGGDLIMAHAISVVVTREEIQELGQMRVAVDALLNDWEKNHRAALGLGPVGEGENATPGRRLLPVDDAAT